MTFIPYANNYVVAEIDMEATLRDVWDPKVREEIQSMTPVKCLMYCETHIDIYIGARIFRMNLIGYGPRIAQPDRFVTADMYYPIHPSPDISHPAGRKPLLADHCFPFSNCCHWLGSDMEMMVRVITKQEVESEGELRPSAVSDSVRIGLQTKDRILVNRARREADDIVRSAAEAFMEEAALSIFEELPGPDAVAEISSRWQREGTGAFRWTKASHCPDGRDSSRWSPNPHQFYPEDSSSFHTASYASSMEPQDEVVGDENPDCFPTLRVWGDLSAHIAQESIPDPTVFADQYRAMTRILQRDVDAPIHAVRCPIIDDAEVREFYEKWLEPIPTQHTTRGKPTRWMPNRLLRFVGSLFCMHP